MRKWERRRRGLLPSEQHYYFPLQQRRASCLASLLGIDERKRRRPALSPPEILRRSVATRANFSRPKPFESNFNAEPPYDKAIDYGITSFPDEVSVASQEA